MKSIQRQPAKRYGEMGFTLIELSIVLVIIGLIIGGVLVGQDLIKAAETRATLAQIEKYNSAVNTFRNKYNGIPGDLLSAATTFGFAGGAGTAGDRDGNGFIGDCGNALGIGYGCESAYFWQDLSIAGFLDASLTASGATVGTANAGSLLTMNSGSMQAAALPPAKLGKGNYIIVSYTGGYNWFAIGGATAAAGIWTLAGNLTPNQAFNMDKKVDDGLPNTGIIQAIQKTALGSATLTSWPGDPTAGVCVTSTANSGTYNLGTIPGDVVACALQWRFN